MLQILKNEGTKPFHYSLGNKKQEFGGSGPQPCIYSCRRYCVQLEREALQAGENACLVALEYTSIF